MVLVVERPLWVWWEASAKPSTEYPFTVIQLRLGKDGRGQGWVSLDVPVSGDTAAGVALTGVDKAAPRLHDVRFESDRS